MPRKKRSRGTCVYCGRHGTLTRDHVPPRNLFGSTSEVQLVTIPCCTKCNGQASKDDEYFRRSLILRHDIPDNPITRELLEAVYRSWRNPRQRGFTRSFLRGVEEKEVYTEGGIYLGQVGTYNVEHHRLDRVVCRIIRGLFYHHSGYPVPRDYHVFSYCHTGVLPSDRPVAKKYVDFAQVVVQSGEEGAVNPDIFKYWFVRTAEDPATTGWLLSFFRSLFFLGGTRRPELAGEAYGRANGKNGVGE